MKQENSLLPLAGLRQWRQALLLALRLRQASDLLLLILLTSLVASSLPLRLTDPTWYLSLADLLISNTAIAITAGCLGFLSQSITPGSGTRSIRSRARFQRVCSILASLYVAVLPLEVFAGSLQFVQINDIYRDQLRSFLDQQQQISQRLRSATSVEVLNSLLPPQPNRLVAAESSTTIVNLAQRRAELLQALDSDGLKMRNGLALQRRQRRLRLVINAIRVLLIAIPTAIFFSILANPSKKLLSKLLRHIPQFARANA